ncbi:DDE-type integrase/transposase/recombinase [Fervidobacterium islandicum]|uniref:DDE-type integrase/transposase/recombinase n=1 Tax=Fervidobacterium islandicum TaxID=2423 RepID=A0AAI8CJX7_FERIS|nr:DDE-type integrase/transposase/recombinase [Fervidobacterium islandicum]AMW31947.2 DDE-type integrase/transposase/recombinase [Fervidobacterium islandicum]
MQNSVVSCPKCGSTNIYKNGHDKYGNQQYFCKDCKRTFRLVHSKKHKLFSFPYPKCPVCGKTMQIHKIKKAFVKFRCRSCHTRDEIPTNLPQFVPLPFDSFKFFRFPIFIVLKAFVLYFKAVSLRSIRDSLNIKVSHVAIYKWILKLSCFFSILVPVDAFKVHGDETVVLFKSKKYYVWFLVEHDSNLIVAWHVSKYRDMGQVKILLEKFFGNNERTIELITDGLGAYGAVKILYKNINHIVVRLGQNNQCESKFSLFQDFVRAKRGFKNIDNLPMYVNSFCVVRNLLKLNKNDIARVICVLLSSITTS